MSHGSRPEIQKILQKARLSNGSLGRARSCIFGISLVRLDVYKSENCERPTLSGAQ